MIGIYGVLQAYAAFEGWKAFVYEFDDGDYFESGAYLGKAIIDAVSVFYLVLMAI